MKTSISSLLIATALALTSLTSIITAFGGSEDKFLKKYAMMKIYESCFGPEVVKQIRKEMKAACAKCAALEAPSPPPPPHLLPTHKLPQEHQFLHSDSQIQHALPHHLQQQEQQHEPHVPPLAFDQEKLQQAILAYRPNNPVYRPSSYPSASLYNPSPFTFYQNPQLFYPQQQQQFPAYGFQMFPPSAFYSPSANNNRVSREMDIKAQIEALTSRLSSKVRNITCVMQELGYLDENLEPNFEKITERLTNLPVNEELRKDMIDGVQFCQQFSQCVPDVKKDRSPLSRELIRPMFFFKCYKHKKLEACIMKDVREKYAGVTDEELDSDVELRRTSKAMRIDQDDGELDRFSSSVYDFLYGSEGDMDMDSFF